MIRWMCTIFAGLLGLAFGSFLNVCVSRWPASESVATPRSHCRACGRMLAWWENVPLLSWIALRGRCRTCGTWIGWRYAVVELAVGGLWAAVAWDAAPYLNDELTANVRMSHIAAAIGSLLFYWLLVALAALDAEQLWLPDWLTITGVGLGITDKVAVEFLLFHSSRGIASISRYDLAIEAAIGALLAAGLILLIRWIYWLLRRREGIGLGDAKLMAMLGAWLGLEDALLAFGVAVVLGSVFAVVILAMRTNHDSESGWATAKLPLGTFLCIGGIVSGLWGQQITDAYLRWAGF